MATHSLKKQQLIQGIGLSLEEQSPGQIQSPESEDRGCCCCCQVASVVSDSVRPHRWQPTRLSHSWDSPGKNTGVVAISFSNAWKWKVKVKTLSRVRLFETPWTAAYQAPLSMDFLGKSTGVGCHWLLRKTVWRFLKKLRIELPYVLALPLLSV